MVQDRLPGFAVQKDGRRGQSREMAWPLGCAGRSAWEGDSRLWTVGGTDGFWRVRVG